MSADRQTTTEDAGTTAECLACSTRYHGRAALGNAARHHDATGHAIRVELVRAITYGEPGAAAAGQTSMDLA